jgi:hypothetical protein
MKRRKHGGVECAIEERLRKSAKKGMMHFKRPWHWRTASMRP